MDLSEGDYGVSLLNDCKYGHDIHDNVIRLTLLRSPTMPDPMADFGEHHFVYSLYPHRGGWDERVQAEAYALNDPIIVYKPEVESRKVDGLGHSSLHHSSLVPPPTSLSRRSSAQRTAMGSSFGCTNRIASVAR